MRTAKDIRFRVWNPDEQEYLNWGPNDPLVDYDASEKETDNANGCVTVIAPDLSKMVFEQWTGIQDRDGQPVYEGDVLEVADEFGDCIPDDIDLNDPRIVQYPTDARGGLIFRGKMREVWFTEGAFKCGLYRFIGSQVRVRGNIHQHPHLLAP